MQSFSPTIYPKSIWSHAVVPDDLSRKEPAFIKCPPFLVSFVRWAFAFSPRWSAELVPSTTGFPPFPSQSPQGD